MIFIVQSHFQDTYPNKLLTAPIFLNARQYILLRKLNAADTQLSRYLVSVYKKDLKRLCLELISRAKLMKNFDKEIVVVFPTKADENLAKLITYGNGIVPGSKILQTALS